MPFVSTHVINAVFIFTAERQLIRGGAWSTISPVSYWFPYHMRARLVDHGSVRQKTKFNRN